MATNVSLTNDEIDSLNGVIDFVEHNADGREDLEELINVDLKRLNNIIKKLKKYNLRSICRNELKKHGANTKENIDKMVADLQKNK